ncbi:MULTISPECIES: periplasmic heavy metal sensor [unclassified Desulfovibrio]|uniref:periplasmic heavy metal sensor n=1 Tax=unclassified Desulfovibrio TaxID=2593640 RepID=UPI0013EC7402|nr:MULTISPECIES: periplasmic heavy metal sensor [unclassified Desulfovibrio]
MSKLPCTLLLAAALLAPAAVSDEAAARGGAPARHAIQNETDQHDLSPEREAHYTRSVRQWLETLPEGQREQALKILQEAHPDVHALRVRIREKKAELESLRFDSTTPPDTLPRIGLELQMLRSQLRRRLLHISEVLRTEVGVPMGPLGEEGFWLNPLTDDRPILPRKGSGLVRPVAAPGRS